MKKYKLTIEICDTCAFLNIESEIAVASISITLVEANYLQEQLNLDLVTHNLDDDNDL